MKGNEEETYGDHKAIQWRGLQRQSNARKSALEMKIVSGKANATYWLALSLTFGRKKPHTHTCVYKYVI